MGLSDGYFPAIDSNVQWCLHADADLTRFDLKHHYLDVLADANGLAGPTG